MFASILSTGLLGVSWLTWSRNFSLRALIIVALIVGAAGSCGVLLDRLRTTTGFFDANFNSELSDNEVIALISELTFIRDKPPAEFADVLICNKRFGNCVFRCELVFPRGMDIDTRTRIGKSYAKHFERVTAELAARRGQQPIAESSRTMRTVVIEH
jgi:hypothetical protein